MTRPGLFWRSLAVYVLVGPIVGGWLFLGVMTIWIAASGDDFKISIWVPSDVLGVLFWLISIFPGNYIIGFVPALGGGVVLAVKDAYGGGASLSFLLATSFFLGLALVALGWWLQPLDFGLLLAAVTVVSSLACWKLTRGMVARSGFAR